MSSLLLIIRMAACVIAAAHHRECLPGWEDSGH